ncbi:MAG: hypothetical protein A2857_00260 [Candidatus Levybacteria bacterium RIFCSPHIGHO2_01_FULL_36_15]|nr:MAG: hypothetical protein A2857_00260 [Candidatus Levybacteria bacterium RIFCSPHIGHO2_01_FULL_36_15]OGH38942.1 MAG: hypothetical protein A2905_05755 [Candidatus Levybacteria bacterium RIFCSPLOWO2_01_FULL_36_10]
MRKISSFLCLILSVIFFITVSPKIIYSDELDDITKQINDLQRSLNMSIQATAPLESQIKDMKKQISDVEDRVSFIEEDIATKRKNIDQSYKNLAKQQDILNKTVRDYYIKTYSFSPLSIFASAQNASIITRLLVYQKRGAERDKAIITNIAVTITSLEQRKKKLEDEEQRLSVIKAKLAVEKQDLQKVVDGAKKYQASLSSEIAQLSAKQQEIIAKRLGSLNIPRSAGTSTRGCIDDRNIDPGFSPRIAFFTYGAPHRNGLNQYGAWGRAKSGQNEEQILQTYYPSMTLKRDYDQGVQISTTTGWSGSIEEYVKRIYEVPDSWTDNNLAVLKAQAVAARTYALNVTGNGSKQICTSEQCQVFKPEPKGGNWEQAVNATTGWVLMDGGNPGYTQYASTHGGYVRNLGKFDGSGGNPGSFSELNERAYDKESPWFYCDWGSRASYNNTAWLKSEEVADMVNVILLARADSSTKDHFYQTDKPHPYGGEVWNEDRVKSELRSRSITPFNNVTDISVNADFGSGKTTSINISGDGGTQSFDGSEFEDWFNLRAPANIQIVGPLFNTEKK